MGNRKKNRILVVIDMQNDFISGSLGSESAKNIVSNVVEKIKNFDGTYIILTQDTHFDNYLETKEGEKLPVKHCIYKTEGWEINQEVLDALKEQENDGVHIQYIAKPTFGAALPMPDIENYHDLVLSVMNIISTENSELEIECCGVETDICVISNVLILKSWFYDCAEFTVDSSCCAGVTPEKHQAALEVMKSCQINVI